MMDWRKWIDKKVYVQLKDDRVYSGKVIEVDNLSNSIDVFFITIIDKFGKRVTFVNTEIVKLEEEN